jgi:hypothetical protein
MFAVGVIIYIIWDINYGLFDVLFAFMGTDKVDPAIFTLATVCFCY